MPHFLHVIAIHGVSFVARAFLSLLYLCNRLTVSGLDRVEIQSKKGNTIYAFWHGRMFYPTSYYAKRIKTPQACILISQSKDGDYATALVQQMKQAVVRGSSSRGGRQAIRDLKTKLEEGCMLALTPDGPRGPAFQVNVGVLKLAQMAGAEIVPVSFDASRKLTLKSWDQFILPLPFARVHLAFGDPISIPPKAEAEPMGHYAELLQEAILELDRQCEGEVNKLKAES